MTSRRGFITTGLGLATGAGAALAQARSAAAQSADPAVKLSLMKCERAAR